MCLAATGRKRSCHDLRRYLGYPPCVVARASFAGLVVSVDHYDNDDENDYHQDGAGDDNHEVGMVIVRPAAMSDASKPKATLTTGTITIMMSAWVRPSPTA